MICGPKGSIKSGLRMKVATRKNAYGIRIQYFVQIAPK